MTQTRISTIVDIIAGQTQGVEKAFGNTSKCVEELTDKLQGFRKQEKAFEGFVKNTEKIEALNKSLKQATQAKALLEGRQSGFAKGSTEFEKAEKGIKKLDDVLKKYNRQLNEAASNLKRTRRTLAETDPEWRKQADHISYASQQLKKLEKNIENVSQQRSGRQRVVGALQEMNLPMMLGVGGGRMSQLGAGLGRLVMPTGGAIVGGLAGGAIAGGAAYALNATLNSYAPLEATLNKIKAIAPDVAQSLAKIEQSSFELGSKTSFNAGEVAIGYKELAKMGYNAQEMLAAMPGLLNAAMVSEMDLATTTEIVAGTLNGFHLAAKESMRVADVLAKAAAVSAADIPDLGEGLKQLAPVAYDSKQGLEEMAASLSILADNMVKGSDAGTDMKAIMLNLFSIEGQGTKKNAGIHAQLDKLGVKITDAKGKMRPFLDIMQDLGKATKGLSDTQRMTLFENIAGKENIKTLSILTAASTGKVNELRTAFDKAGGSSDKAAKVMRDGVGAAADEVAGSFDTMNAKLGKLFAPATIAGLNLLKQTLDTINQGILEPALNPESTAEKIKQKQANSGAYIPGVAPFPQLTRPNDNKKRIQEASGVSFLPKALGGNTTTVINMGKVTIQAQNPKDFVKQTQAHAKQTQRLKKS